MKRNLSIIFAGMALLFCIRGQCQTFSPFTFNIAGGSYDNPASYLHLEWSVGESTVIDYYRLPDSSFALSNGVLQPCTEKTTKSGPNIFMFQGNEYRLFPNVSTGQFELNFFLNLAGEMNLQLTDAAGRVLDKRQYRYQCCDRIERYDLSNQPDGVYFIHATFKPDEKSQGDNVWRRSSFRIVKIKN